MTDSLAVRETFETVVSKADTLVKSGFLPSSVKTKEQAVAIMTMANELGIGVWAGFNGINVIQGKPTVSPQLMLALINRSGQLEDITIEAGTTQATVMMKRKGRTAHIETFTIQDAQRLKTTEWVDGKKNTISLADKYNWKQQPAVMLKWRAVSACARVVFSDVIMGFYTPEEIDPDITIDPDTGEMTGRAEIQPSRASALPIYTIDQSEPGYETGPDNAVAIRAIPPASGRIDLAEVFPRDDEPTPQIVPHWTQDQNWKKFYMWCTKDLGLTHDEVHEALEVPSAKLFAGSKREAQAKLEAYAAEKRVKNAEFPEDVELSNLEEVPAMELAWNEALKADLWDHASVAHVTPNQLFKGAGVKNAAELYLKYNPTQAHIQVDYVARAK